ncbi:MAG: hypothetical protein LQ347_003815 [Umbilicaria vellea]|nr:MAG: hypothetical protein LQ347_003815 [Umbilicaria vellea]
MQALKNLVTGRSDETQSGQEPASGQTGAGTINEPYDAGNTTGNKGPHTISIANKLDPNVDSDGDGKPRSGPADIEHATVGSVSTGSGMN